MCSSENNGIELLRVCDLVDFENQPFKVLDDEAMDELTESIKEVGILVPIIVRKAVEGKYEIISGHRRKCACKKAGIETIPAVVAELDDDQAAILLVDSNLQRERLLPSERAYAYKMKLDAMKHQGSRTELTCGQNVHKLKSRDLIGEVSGESGRQVQRYIRLTELIFQLMNKVDEKIIPVTAGTELSYIGSKNQAIVNDILDYEFCGLSLQQAVKIKQLCIDGNISREAIEKVVTDNNSRYEEKISLNYIRLKKYFPKNYSVKQCEAALWRILDEWYRKQKLIYD